MADVLTGLLSYNSSTSTTQDTASTNSKSYVDKSFDFNNILESVHKNYPKQTVADQQKQVLNSQKQVSKQDTSSSDVNNHNHKVETDNKTTEHSQVHDSSHKIDTNKENDNVNKNHISRNDVGNNNKQAKTVLSQDNEVSNNNNSNANANDDNDSKGIDNTRPNDSANNTQAQTVTSSNSSEPINQMSPLVAITAIAAAILPNNSEKNDTQTPVNTEQKTSQDNQVKQIAPAQLPDANFGVDLTKISNEQQNDIQNENIQKSTRVRVQPQTQQLLLNLSAKDDAQGSAVQTNTEVQNQAPVIQANADVVTNAATDSAPKQSIKEILEKAALNQDILDKTNARVVSVETTSSSSNNLLNQDNAQGQSAKLAFENINNVVNSNIGNVTDNTTQASFTKTLDNAQQPKEISHTEILSQINSKLNEVKDDSTTKVTIVLKPENLGKINLEMINGKDGFTASLTAENSHVKELLDKNLEGLRNTLGNQGLNVNNVTVKVAETQKQSSDMFTFDQQKQGQSNQQSSNDSQKSNQGNSRFNEEFFGSGDPTITEEPIKTASYDGQIDYKI